MMFERIGVFAQLGEDGARAIEVASALAAPHHASVIDRRHDRIDATAMHRDASLVVVSAPHPQDRHWLSVVGEPLVRAAAGPVLFVPDLEMSGGSL